MSKTSGGNDHRWKEKCRKSEKPKLGLNSDANYWKITTHSLTEGFGNLKRIRIGIQFEFLLGIFIPKLH